MMSEGFQKRKSKILMVRRIQTAIYREKINRGESEKQEKIRDKG